MRLTGKRILLVEDHEDTRDFLILLLEQAGCSVLTAGTVTDALKLSRGETFDLYLLDNRLPDGTGIDLCHQLRRLHPRTPILFCSGAADASDREQALTAGAQAYLSKPTDLGLLDKTILKLLDGAL